METQQPGADGADGADGTISTLRKPCCVWHQRYVFSCTFSEKPSLGGYLLRKKIQKVISIYSNLIPHVAQRIATSISMSVWQLGDFIPDMFYGISPTIIYLCPPMNNSASAPGLVQKQQKKHHFIVHDGASNLY